MSQAKQDNIEQMYAKFMGNPGTLQKSLANFNEITENNFESFCRIFKDHQHMGKAAILGMAHNYATHIIKMASDTSVDLNTRIAQITGCVAPMYSLMYDRMVSEAIEKLEP